MNDRTPSLRRMDVGYHRLSVRESVPPPKVSPLFPTAGAHAHTYQSAKKHPKGATQNPYTTPSAICCALFTLGSYAVYHFRAYVDLAMYNALGFVLLPWFFYVNQTYGKRIVRGKIVDGEISRATMTKAAILYWVICVAVGVVVNLLP